MSLHIPYHYTNQTHLMREQSDGYTTTEISQISQLCDSQACEIYYDLGSPSNMVRLRNALIERDIIFSEMNKLYITGPVFTLWFRRRFC